MTDHIYTVFCQQFGWIATECRSAEEVLSSIQSLVAKQQKAGYILAVKTGLAGDLRLVAERTQLKIAVLVDDDIEDVDLLFEVDRYQLADALPDPRLVNSCLIGRTIGDILMPDLPLPSE